MKNRRLWHHVLNAIALTSVTVALLVIRVMATKGPSWHRNYEQRGPGWWRIEVQQDRLAIELVLTHLVDPSRQRYMKFDQGWTSFGRRSVIIVGWEHARLQDRRTGGASLAPVIAAAISNKVLLALLLLLPTTIWLYRLRQTRKDKADVGFPVPITRQEAEAEHPADGSPHG